MANEAPRPITASPTLRAAFSRLSWALTHTSPLRLLLLICVAIALTHSFTMFSLQLWHAMLPYWAHSLVESALLVLVLFPALYFFSFRPLTTQVIEREHAERTMWASEQKYRSLFNSLGDAAFLIDVKTGRIIDANRQAETMLARERGEIVGARREILFSAEQRDELGARLCCTGREEAVSFEGVVQTSTGGQVPVHVSAASLELFGRDLVVTLFRDITDFKTLHAELLRAQRMESVGALASGIAHDLNNALTPILFASEMLRVQLRERADPKLLEAISASAGRATQVVRQMLTFVRGGESHRADVQLRHLVREAADMARVAFPKSIEIRQDIPAVLWTVQADATQLSQVLMNLAVNARDAMPDGGELGFSAENLTITDSGAPDIPGLNAGDYVVLTIADTGCGIPSEIRERIFDPFFTTKPAGKGTGLGLATTRDIVTSHGGFIDVTSRPGHGTRFRIFLPATRETVAESAPTRVADMPKGNGELILIADDEAAILEMARVALEAANYRVLLATDGAEAVARGAENKAELRLAVLDVGMPILGGAAAQRALHKINPALRIIRVTGSVASAESAALEKSDGFTLLQKPFSVGQLLVAVHETLQRPPPAF